MTSNEPNLAGTEEPKDVGSVFVSNYPPYSFWRGEDVGEALAALDAAPGEGTSLGLYLHIPFCRLRYKFCYFRVYTDKDSSEVRRYLRALEREVRLYSERPAVAGRPLLFVYFGGGTPSLISSRDLRELARNLKAAMPWDGAPEVTFECEPGTLTRSKVEAIREIGVTRLSLGVESFDDGILKENGRAHLREEIERSWPWIREARFDQVNIDLIAGMVGETWETWRDSVRRTIELDPDGITIYQMELPFNTVYSQDVLDGKLQVAGWEDKRRWHDFAIQELSAAGYEISSAYTMVRKGTGSRFVYRDAVWHGTDMVGTGVASFSHMSGVHFQNVPEWSDYFAMLDDGRLPLERAFRTGPREQLTREALLQLKLGKLDAGYFRRKFGADVLEEFRSAWETLQSRGMLEVPGDRIELTRQGLLQVDRLLPELYEPRYRNARYT